MEKVSNFLVQFFGGMCEVGRGFLGNFKWTRDTFAASSLAARLERDTFPIFGDRYDPIL